MSCTKAQVLALLYRILDDISECNTIECCKSVLNTYIAAVRDKSFIELERELFT